MFNILFIIGKNMLEYYYNYSNYEILLYFFLIIIENIKNIKC